MTMHLVRKEFEMDRDWGLRFAAERGFGLLVAFDEGRARSSHLPFVLKCEGDSAVVTLHVTSANPLAALADGREAMLAVIGDDAYISNDWYHNPDQVSTWLYEAVHLSGPARRRQIADNRSHGDDLLATCEARIADKPPWDLSTMEPVKRESMLNRIVVIDIAVERVDCQRKLNQFKPDPDHVAVVRALAGHPDDAARRLGAKMRALRPTLDYGDHNNLA